MPDQSFPSSAADNHRTRIGSWKEIAAYLGRSVRTVQRWERQAGLPVRRYPTQNGETVFAFRDELDAWTHGSSGTAGPARDGVSAQEPATMSGGESAVPEPDAAPRAARPVRAAVMLAAALALAAMVALVGWSGRHAATTDPVTTRLDYREISARDAAGVLLWKSKLAYVPNSGEKEYAEYEQIQSPVRHVRVLDDVDRDGHPELLIATLDSAAFAGDVACYDARGHQRWTRHGDRVARFGYGTMGPPWVSFFFTLSRPTSDSSPSLWISWANRPEFGAFVERIDVRTGRPAAVYWSAGYVTAVATGTIEGRRVVFVGACNNEHGAASLAVYDANVVSGAAPAANQRYACLDCRGTPPMAFLVFPKTSLGRELKGSTSALAVDEIMQDAAGQVTVFVEQGAMALRGVHSAIVMYKLDSRLRLTGAESLDNYRLEHRRLEREGRIDRPFTIEADRELFPVWSWKDGKYVSIPGPER